MRVDPYKGWCCRRWLGPPSNFPFQILSQNFGACLHIICLGLTSQAPHLCVDRTKRERRPASPHTEHTAHGRAQVECWCAISGVWCGEWSEWMEYAVVWYQWSVVWSGVEWWYHGGAAPSSTSKKRGSSGGISSRAGSTVLRGCNLRISEVESKCHELQGYIQWRSYRSARADNMRRASGLTRKAHELGQGESILQRPVATSHKSAIAHKTALCVG